MMMKLFRNIALMLALCAAAASCGGEKDFSAEDYLDFLYEYMPMPDSVAYSRDFWEANVAKTLEVRDRMGWGVPEREFRHFVLPLRVNNETLDDFRTLYADTLCSRVAGLPLAEAALEINHWCHEQATYAPSDGRTSAPCATVRRGLGRCGEESVLAVAALRAAGIPARQVYTPRWAHTDDNHAWVEVWVDGKWHFLGACEPEPRLDMGWFNAPVSRAMILHTKVFGDYHGDEDVICRISCYTEINVIRGYVDARVSEVAVVDTLGAPVEGADVEFMIYNYGEFFSVARYNTDSEGKAKLDTGCGDMMIWASKGGCFGLAKTEGEHTVVVLDHLIGERCSLDFDIVPPPENPIVTDASEADIENNAKRLAEEDLIRESHPHDNPAVTAFLESHPGPEAAALVASLSEKDRTDVTADVLEDAFGHFCPRVELEPLKPFYGEIGEGVEVASPADVAAWVEANITLDTLCNPQGLRMAPVDVWRSLRADPHSRDIFYTALCRAKGFDVKLDALTGGAVVEESPKGRISAKCGTTPAPEYYHHFTLSRIADGSPLLLNYGEDSDNYAWNKVFPLDVEAGYYMLTSGSRMADGSVLAHVEFFTVEAGGSTEIPLVMRSSGDKIAVIGTMDPEIRFLPEGSRKEASLLSATGRGFFLVAVLGDGDEPSNHAVRELEDAAELLNGWGRKCVVLGGEKVSSLKHAVYGTDPDGKVLKNLCSGAEVALCEPPVTAVCDSFGRTVYISQGYNPSLAEDLKRIIPKL